MTLADDAVAATLADFGVVESVFQPIVEIASGDIVGFEALARWPEVGDVDPADVFAAAHEVGQLHRVDWAGRLAALTGATDAGLGRDYTLFVNVEPGLRRELFPLNDISVDVIRDLSSRLRIVIELTERGLLADPATLLDTAAWARAHGYGIALDDVGANSETLALLPFLAPDIIKLDGSLVREMPTADAAIALTAVFEHAERTGARILAEGVETDDNVEQAISLGASLGQGWYFGKPGLLGTAGEHRTPPIRYSIAPSRADTTEAIPFLDPPITPSVPSDLFGESHQPRVIRPGLLARLSRAIEIQAMASLVPLTVLASFQHEDRFTAPTRTQYERLAEKHPFVALLGPIASHRDPRVLSAPVEEGEPFGSEWTLVVVGPQYAVVVIAREIDAAADGRRFEYVLSYDRSLAIAAGRSLIARILPAATAPTTDIAPTADDAANDVLAPPPDSGVG